MKLSAELKLAIEEHPTKTYIRSSSEHAETQFTSVPNRSFAYKVDLPKNFKGQEVWSEVLSPVKNQGKCGSCWAFAGSSTLADRFNIQSYGYLHLNLSPAKLVLCNLRGKEWDVEHPQIDAAEYAELAAANTGISSCSGNTMTDTWRYLFTIGTNTTDCVPYGKTIGGGLVFDSLSDYKSNDNLPLCTVTMGKVGDMCVGVMLNTETDEEYGEPARFYRCIHYYTVLGEENIMHDIYRWGPVSTGMMVYANFYTFDPKTEIYAWDGKGEKIGGHAVQIIGWGEERGEKFWWIRNSWGTDWGLGGYFKMKRGVNECELETNIVTGMPDFFYPYGYKYPNSDKYNWSESEEDKKNRETLSDDFHITSGGIDPLTGYTRRIMATKAWKDVRAPIDYKIVPDWNTFVAGLNFKKSSYKFQIDADYNRENSVMKNHSDQPIIFSFLAILYILIISAPFLRRL